VGLRHGIRSFVFSSTGTVYSDPADLPFTEESTTSIDLSNAYSKSKRINEVVLADVARVIPSSTSRCCATSTRWARTRAASSARIRPASRTTSCRSSARVAVGQAREDRRVRRRLRHTRRHRPA
jgi:nucleoside-diphosphate-sugar epimerase